MSEHFIDSYIVDIFFFVNPPVFLHVHIRLGCFMKPGVVYATTIRPIFLRVHYEFLVWFCQLFHHFSHCIHCIQFSLSNCNVFQFALSLGVAWHRIKLFTFFFCTLCYQWFKKNYDRYVGKINFQFNNNCFRYPRKLFSCLDISPHPLSFFSLI